MVQWVDEKRRARYAREKRGWDILFSAAGLLLLLPLFGLIACVILFFDGRPVFFAQVRMGRGLEPFVLYKFRTMSRAAPHDAPTATLAADRYITPLGAFLRRHSLDELPQLYNVLRGDMSLLGPRPVVLRESELILRRTAAGVYDVRPGMSGLAQVRGRDLLSDAEKTACDREYVRTLSLGRDIRLLASTVAAVLSRRGVQEGSALS